MKHLQSLNYKDIDIINALHHDTNGTIEVSHINKAVEKGTRSFYHIRRKYSTLIKHNHITTLKDTHNNIDMYFSLNSFKFCKRTQDALYELKALYTDLDFYKLNLTQEQVLTHLDLLVQQKKIPLPSFIVDSGRGLYLIWKINNTPPQALVRWKYCMNVIHNYFKDVGADASCIDSARIFRMTGSINSHNKKTVTVIGGSASTYNINGLYKNYFAITIPSTDSNISKPTQKKIKKLYTYHKTRNVLYLHNQYKSYLIRVQDLVKLAELREYDIKKYKCREMMIFLMRYWCCCSGDSDDAALEKALSFNAQFREPLTEQEVIQVAKPNRDAIRKHIYCYSNKRIIELLSISEQEQYELKSIHTNEVRLKKLDAKRKAERRNENGLTVKQQTLANERLEVQRLMQANHKTKDIAQLLNMNERKVRRLIQQIKEC